jgi:S1-C subfamily serine protease
MGVEFEQIGFDVVAKRLIPGSLAQIAGMREGDVLEKVGDKRATSIGRALILMSFVQPDTLKLSVRRDDGPHELLVVRRSA